MTTRNAAALFLGLTVLLTWPLALRPALATLPMGPDGDLFIWTLAWDAHAFMSRPLAIFDANIYHPLRHTLAVSENLIGSALISAPIQWTTGNPVLALSVVALGAWNEVAAHCLADVRLTRALANRLRALPPVVAF